ncbi:uncharacterized protein HD556DRAFT_1532515 [Suillus plorans]|uniref:Uncharacterized protein n=1 Tax=Suillus plorans TaxID=116603 RepID=A0A9P7J7E1_9AGAM|nr:uncharacterized protein HD556DRAFT_1532515 [Suillus plorans]KAG1806453.1 hypothetical protein HD556DRAFT_1532515 [Suillus plorans]
MALSAQSDESYRIIRFLACRFQWFSHFINGKNIRVPSKHIPAGIYISVKVDSQRRRKSAISVLSSNKSVAWGNTMTLTSHSLPALSVEIRASYELGRMVSGGEVVGGLQMPWNELLDHGDEPFDLSFPPVHGVHPSLKLKAAIVHACDHQDDALFDSLLDCEIPRDTDAGHVQVAAYMTSKIVSHLNDAVEHFQLVLDQCPVSHPDHATALTNLAWARLKGYIRNDLQDIDATTSLSRDALALRPQPHPDHPLPLSLYNLTEVLTWRHNKKSTAADICEAAQLYHELLPLCPEGTYLCSIAAGKNGVDYTHPMKTSIFDESSSSSVLWAINSVPEPSTCLHTQLKDISISTATSMILTRAYSFVVKPHLCPEGHTVHTAYLDNLAVSLMSPRYNHQGKPNDLNEAISLHEEALRLRPVGHKYRTDVAPTGHPPHDTTLNNLALALNTRYNESHVSEGLNEAIDLYREFLRLKRLDHPGRRATLINLSSVLCSRFTQTQKNEDVEEAITLCKQSLKALHLPQPDRYYSYFRLQEASLPDSTRPMTQSSFTSQREATTAFCGARSLPVDVTSCVIRRDNLRRAVELVEQGRGQQWSLASRLRTPVEDLESAHPTLACDYLQLSKRVSNAAQSSVTVTDRAAADRLPPSYKRQRARAQSSSSLRVNACAALSRHQQTSIISEDSQGLLHQGNMRRVEDGSHSALADNIGPDHATHRQPFTSIPLHAAHPFQTKAYRSGKQPCLEDPHICSYTPTLSALIRSRQLMKKRMPPSFVAIGQGQTGAGKCKTLLAVDSELEPVHKLVPATANRTTISGGAATQGGALEALQ